MNRLTSTCFLATRFAYKCLGLNQIIKRTYPDPTPCGDRFRPRPPGVGCVLSAEGPSARPSPAAPPRAGALSAGALSVGDPTGRHVCILADRRTVMQTELCTGGRIPAFGYIYICILPLSFRWGTCHYRKARALRKLFGLSPRVVHRVVRFKQQWT